MIKFLTYIDSNQRLSIVDIEKLYNISTFLTASAQGKYNQEKMLLNKLIPLTLKRCSELSKELEQLRGMMSNEAVHYQGAYFIHAEIVKVFNKFVQVMECSEKAIFELEDLNQEQITFSSSAALKEAMNNSLEIKELAFNAISRLISEEQNYLQSVTSLLMRIYNNGPH